MCPPYMSAYVCALHVCSDVAASSGRPSNSACLEPTPRSRKTRDAGTDHQPCQIGMLPRPRYPSVLWSLPGSNWAEEVHRDGAVGLRRGMSRWSGHWRISTQAVLECSIAIKCYPGPTRAVPGSTVLWRETWPVPPLPRAGVCTCAVTICNEVCCCPYCTSTARTDGSRATVFVRC